MRIGLLSNPELVNSYYRSWLPLGALERRGHEVLRNERDRPLEPQLLAQCDVVHVHRNTTPEVLQVLRRLRRLGVGVVWDNDDDVNAIPRTNPAYKRRGAALRRQVALGLQEMMRVAHVVTTPSAVLAEKFREQGATDVRVIENHLPPEFAKTPRRRHDGVVVACVASLEHSVDYEQLRMREQLGALLDANAELRVVSFGLGLGLRHERYEQDPGVPFLELARALSAADLGLAPLVDIPWNRARSNVKAKEYAAAGAAWLASPVGPYLGMGEQQGGRLVPDDGWYEAIERLVRNGRERRKLAKRGAKWVKGEYVEAHAGAWEAALRDAAERARRAVGGARQPEPSGRAVTGLQ